MSFKLSFVINSLSGGGAERVFATVVGALSETYPSVDCSVVLLDALPEEQALPEGLCKTVLGTEGGMLSSISRLHAHFRKERPDLVVSFLARANCASIIASRSLGFPCVIRECTHTTTHYGNSISGRLNRSIIRALYPRADKVIAVSEGVRMQLARDYAVPESKLATLYNPVDIAALQRLADEPVTEPLPDRFFVAVGRLVPGKNIPMLLEAYAEARPAEALVLVGDGSERPRLERLAADLGLGQSVRFLGFLRNPYPVMARARALLSASNYEGFPNALIEALALSVPVVSTDCASGPSEILDEAADQGRIGRMTPAAWGILTPVEDTTAMVEAIRQIQVPAVRDRYAQRGSIRAERFARARIMREYEALLTPYLQPASITGPT